MGFIPMTGYAIVNLAALVLESIWILMGMPWKDSFMRGMSRAELNGTAIPQEQRGNVSLSLNDKKLEIDGLSSRAV